MKAHVGIEINLYEKILKLRVERFSSKCGEQLEQWRELGELHGWFGTFIWDLMVT